MTETEAMEKLQRIIDCQEKIIDAIARLDWSTIEYNADEISQLAASLKVYAAKN